MAEKKPAKDNRNIYQRLADVMRECTYVQKEKPKGMQYAIVSHDKVTAKVRPYLLKHGVYYGSTVESLTQDGNRTAAKVITKFVNVDNPEDTITTVTFGYGIDSQDKGPGKAISYAVKYALLKNLGLETGEDADLESLEYDDSKPGEYTDGYTQAQLEQAYETVKNGLSEYCEKTGADPKNVNQFIMREFEGRTINNVKGDPPTLYKMLKEVESNYTPEIGDN